MHWPCCRDTQVLGIPHYLGIHNMEYKISKKHHHLSKKTFTLMKNVLLFQKSHVTWLHVEYIHVGQHSQATYNNIFQSINSGTKSCWPQFTFIWWQWNLLSPVPQELTPLSEADTSPTYPTTNSKEQFIEFTRSRLLPVWVAKKPTGGRLKIWEDWLRHWHLFL
jgi:hypothetical protein